MGGLAALAVALALLAGEAARAGDAMWVAGYYRAVKQDFMPPEELDFSVLTHVVHFSVMPNDDGTLNTQRQKLTDERIRSLVAAAHGAERKALICVGGADSGAFFTAATEPAHLDTFVRSLTNFVAEWHYDGVDLDWEPVAETNNAAFVALVGQLRSALDAFPEHKLLTVAINPWPKSPTTWPMLAGLQPKLDQVNLMSYHTSGPRKGWITWFNSPLYSGTTKFHNGRPVPSTDTGVTGCLAAKLDPAKVGLGLAFYGMVWTGGPGVTGPRQAWPPANPPVMTDTTYPQILARYYQPANYHWDAEAQAPYLSITNAVPTKSLFVSYEDPRSCRNKVDYARSHQLGGIMIWELSQDYSPNLPKGQRSPLLAALKAELERK